MEIIGIICEYNPFHNGHIYHINEIKKRYPDSLIVLVLNGYFLERGEISIVSKEDKTRIALANNVDLVLELPCLFGTQSADTFAYKSIYLLNKLNVKKIIFGSETDDIKKIVKIAKETENESYADKIKELLNTGVNYPTALAKSLKTEFTFMPNDLLGISYVKAIFKINHEIIPETIRRTSDYLDLKSTENIISAANIRNKIKNGDVITNYLPFASLRSIKEINYDLYFKLIKTIINRDEHLDQILDVDEGVEYRLKELINKTNNIDEFISMVKTKRYTYNKINRMLIHILLGIKKEDAQLDIDYLKILGLSEKGRKYLNSIKKDIDIPLNVNKNSKIYEYELKASIIYDLLTDGKNYEIELNNKPIINE